MRAPNESLGGDVFPKSVCTERMPLLKGEVPAAQAVGFSFKDLGRSDLWQPTVVDRMRGAKRSRLGEAPLRFALPHTPTEVCPAGGACTRLLPRILSTTVGRHRAGPGSTCCRRFYRRIREA